VKRVTLLIVCFLLVLSAYVFNPTEIPAGEIHGNVEIGQNPNTQQIFSIVNISYDFDLWIFDNSIYSGIEVWSLPADEINPVSPFLDTYKIGYTISYKIFYINIYHWCSHPVYHNQSSIVWRETIKLDQEATTIAVGIRW